MVSLSKFRGSNEELGINPKNIIEQNKAKKLETTKIETKKKEIKQEDSQFSLFEEVQK